MLTAGNVSRSFRRGSRTTEAVRPATLQLSPGTLTAVTGPSGSGKSTLLHLLGGLLRPTTGTVELDGEDLYRLPDRSLSRLRGCRFGVIPQGESALHSLTVLENVLLPCALYPGGRSEEDARTLLEQADIGHLASERPAHLSGGELRRMAVVRALMRQPDVLLADEPTNDLDSEHADAVMELLRQEAERGAAVLLVTHAASALKHADIVYGMSSGILRLL